MFSFFEVVGCGYVVLNGGGLKLVRCTQGVLHCTTAVLASVVVARLSCGQSARTLICRARFILALLVVKL